MEKFLEQLNNLGIKTVIKDGLKGAGVEYDKTIHFPEVSERGFFLLGKVYGNKFYLHQRIGMYGTDWDFGTFDSIDEDKIRFLKDLYFRMKADIEKLRRETIRK
jgi:hypothetical protein